jgi:hypothetical protein
MSHKISQRDAQITQLLAMGFAPIQKTTNMFSRLTHTGYYEVATLGTAPSGFTTVSITASKNGGLPSHAKAR